MVHSAYHTCKRRPDLPVVWYPRPVLIALGVPADNDRGPRYLEHALAAIHQANPRRLPMELAFARHQKNVTLLVRSLPELAAATASQLAAHYPAAIMSRLADDAVATPPGSSIWPTELHLTPHLFRVWQVFLAGRNVGGTRRVPDSAHGVCGLHCQETLPHSLFPIRRYPRFDDTLNRNVSDPLTAIFATPASGPRGRKGDRHIFSGAMAEKGSQAPWRSRSSTATVGGRVRQV